MSGPAVSRLGCGEGFVLTQFDVGWLLLVPTQRWWGWDAQGTLHELSVPAPSGQSFGSALLAMPGPLPLRRPGVVALPGRGVPPGFGGTQACLMAPCTVMGHEGHFSRQSLPLWWGDPQLPGWWGEPSLGDRLPCLAFGIRQLRSRYFTKKAKCVFTAYQL